MKIGSFIRTKKFLLSFLFNTIVLTLIGVSFSQLINQSFYSYETWNNCTSKYVAYDSRKFTKNYYYYYGDNVIVSLNSGDGIVVKADVYQFIDGIEYDTDSLLNEKNIVAGNYSNLKNGEIAIPLPIANKYKLKIGDTLILDDTLSFKVKYIFRSLYNIKEPSITNSGNVVFIGYEGIFETEHMYAGFSSDTDVFNDVYPFANAKSEFSKTLCLYLSLTIVLALIAESVIILIYRKQEKKNLYEELLSGSRTSYFQSLIIVNLLLHVLPVLYSSLFLIVFGWYLSAIAIIVAVLLITLMKCAALRIRIH